MRLQHTYLNKAHSVGSQINQVKFRLQVTGDRLQGTEDQGQASGGRGPLGTALPGKFSRALKVDFHYPPDHVFPVGATARHHHQITPFSLPPVTAKLSPHSLSPVPYYLLRSRHP
jgi:hypothetical protein